MSAVEAEGQWMVSLEAGAKAKFLASLSHELTIVGRGASYEVGTDGLTRPELLRHVNEIQHRVSACLSQLLRGEGNESFERSIANWVLEAPDRELRRWTAQAWQHAKSYIFRPN
ncbi:MAG TPA: hypothetical protein VFR18_04790 [Terriglobia bacterium]|nr:hypothetical protein [Terriglobia bacterium]